jgi:ribonuclease G
MPVELLVCRRGGETWVARTVAGRVAELRVELDEADAAVGRIFKGRVSKVLPGIQSAFVDIGTERHAFLHVTDLWLPGESPPATAQAIAIRTAGGGVEIEREPPPVADGTRPIQDRLKVGREIVVQIVREPLGHKGARVSCFLTVVGRLLVLFPGLPLRAVSRRLGRSAERGRLLEILAGLDPPGAGYVARTAAAGATEDRLRLQARALLDSWESIDRRLVGGDVPRIVEREPELLLRALRDAPEGGYDRVVVGEQAQLERAREYLDGIDPSFATRLDLHPGPEPLFQAFGIDTEGERALRPRVWLKSGGHIVIEETEALVSIDVNTGKFVGKRKHGETVAKTNLEAAGEIARQLRLRDLGGIVVIDFIDMMEESDRQEVLETLKAALQDDPARTRVVGFSELGLVQLTRKRTRPSLMERLSGSCPTCRGLGRLRRGESADNGPQSEPSAP